MLKTCSKCPQARAILDAARDGADMTMVAVLFARADSCYKTLPRVDVFDIERDARKWHGGAPVVAHPPCRAWGRLRHMARPRPDEKDLARWAVKQVRQFGGVLEHPNASTLWADQGLPAPGARDEFGGFTYPVLQKWWGHRAAKSTLLYVVGCEPRDLPTIPYDIAEATHVVGTSGRRKDGTRKKGSKEITKAEREHTPLEFAKWLVEVARRCA